MSPWRKTGSPGAGNQIQRRLTTPAAATTNHGVVRAIRLAAVLAVLPACSRPVTAAADPLPSWRDGKAKKAIFEFVERSTARDSPDRIPEAERIATFDNDGTLWAEKPIPFQLAFALDRVKALAGAHPEWKTKPPFAGLLAGDRDAVAAAGDKGVAEILAATHAGMTTEAFTALVNEWITTARHPKTGRLYTEMVYQPMLDLLAYLRGKGFRTFIASGGGVEFMRAWSERVYGIPPDQVIGSTGKLALEERDGRPVLVKRPEIDLVDDRAGKPVGIYTRIGRRPIAAFGNSDGDLEMLEWTAAGRGPRFALLVHHDDGDREVQYDRGDKLAKLDRAWDEAVERGWTVVSMKRDWATVFPGSTGK